MSNTCKLIKETDRNMLRQVRRTPLLLSNLFYELTIMLWQDPANLPNGVRPWKAGLNETDTQENDWTFIDVTNNWSDNNIERRPAIFVDIGDLQLNNTALESTFGSGAYVNLKEGTKSYARVVSGSVVWAHLAEKRGEAMLYAAASYDLLDGLSPVIENDFCFENFNITSILKPKQRKDQPRDWECLVQATFQFRENFDIKFESPKLKQITFKADAGIDQHINLVR